MSVDLPSEESSRRIAELERENAKLRKTAISFSTNP
jgi:hypothetical protein